MQEPLSPVATNGTSTPSTTLPTRPVGSRTSISSSSSDRPVAPGAARPSVRLSFARRRWRLLLILAAIVGSLSIFLAGTGVGARSGKMSADGSQSTPREVLEQVRQEIVPADNSPTTYGVSFNEQGYQTLLSWHSQYKVSQAEAASFEALDLTLPCCGFGHPSADEATNCGCGHHQALYGLSKRLFELGYNEKSVQTEVTRWAAYFFPRETLESVLSERAVSDPAMQQALDELKQNGGC